MGEAWSAGRGGAGATRRAPPREARGGRFGAIAGEFRRGSARAELPDRGKKVEPKDKVATYRLLAPSLRTLLNHLLFISSMKNRK
jgi:hypothetical protein